MAKENNPLKIAVITGGHAYNVPKFHELWRSYQGEAFDVYLQPMDDFASSPEDVRNAYDVVIFFIMLKGQPTDENMEWYEGKPGTAMMDLINGEQGIFILHHALLAYENWPAWDGLVGAGEREAFTYDIGEEIRVAGVDGDHPITEGLSDWDMIDEVYGMAEPSDEDVRVLLTTDHPKSMEKIGWVHEYEGSRVFCFQSGHDDRTWENENFREVVRRGMLWCGGEI